MRGEMWTLPKEAVAFTSSTPGLETYRGENETRLNQPVAYSVSAS